MILNNFSSILAQDVVLYCMWMSKKIESDLCQVLDFYQFTVSIWVSDIESKTSGSFSSSECLCNISQH